MSNTMSAPVLSQPGEPQALKRVARALLEQAPDTGLPLITAGEWIVDPLWLRWSAVLESRGMSRDSLSRIVAEYGNELRLWVVGERPWDHYVSGLSGRITRRLAPFPAELAGSEEWSTALARVGLAVDATLQTVTTTLDELHLLHDLMPDGDRDTVFAVVWAGGRPRDPEAPVGEGRAESPAAALVEALGRFLLRDPAYPPQTAFTP